jgi:hypothetical protein
MSVTIKARMSPSWPAVAGSSGAVSFLLSIGRARGLGKRNQV